MITRVDSAVQARECNSSVDTVTLLSLLPICFVDRHVARVGEATIESDPQNWAWCSNPKCQKVIRRHALRHTGKISVVGYTSSLEIDVDILDRLDLES